MLLSTSSRPNRPRVNVRGIEQPIALQVLKTLARYERQEAPGSTYHASELSLVTRSAHWSLVVKRKS